MKNKSEIMKEVNMRRKRSLYYYQYDFLYKNYIIQKKSSNQIAKEVGVDQVTIANYLKEQNIFHLRNGFRDGAKKREGRYRIFGGKSKLHGSKIGRGIKKVWESRSSEERFNVVSGMLEGSKTSPGQKSYKRGYLVNNSNNRKEFYASSYEYKFMLKLNSTSLKYTKNHRISILYKINSESKNYIPDYLVDNKILVEIKPKCKINSEMNQAKFKAARGYCKKNGLDFQIWTESELGL